MLTNTISLLTPLPTCPRDGTATRLSCARCGRPICPACLVQTPTGMRCPACAGPQQPAARRRSRRPFAVVALGLAASVAFALLPRALAPGGDGQGAPVEVETLPPSAVPGVGEEVVVGPFVVTVEGFECRDEQTGTEPPVPIRRCRAQLLVRHDGPGARQFPTSLQRAAEASRRFVPTTRTALTVNPGAVTEVAVDYTLPPNIEPTRLELRGSPRQTPVRVALPT